MPNPDLLVENRNAIPCLHDFNFNKAYLTEFLLMLCDSELAEESLEEGFPNHGEGNWDAGAQLHRLGFEASWLGVCSLGLK